MNIKILCQLLLLIISLQVIAESDTVESKLQSKLALARKNYEKKVKEIKNSAISEYKNLVKIKRRDGDIEEAERLENKIALLQGKKPPHVRGKNTKTIIVEREKYYSKSKAPMAGEYYWIELDQSKGFIDLTFPLSQIKKPKKIFLRVFTFAVANASSNDIISIFSKRKEVGRVKSPAKGKWQEVELDTKKMSLKKSKIKLRLKSNGNDGWALAGKKSGKGSQLKLIF